MDDDTRRVLLSSVAGRTTSKVKVHIACERLLLEFIVVAAVALTVAPRLRRSKRSCTHKIWVSSGCFVTCEEEEAEGGGKATERQK